MLLQLSQALLMIITSLPNKITAKCFLHMLYFAISAVGGYPSLRFDPSKTQINGEAVFPTVTRAEKTLSAKTAPDSQKTYCLRNGIKAKGIDASVV